MTRALITGVTGCVGSNLAAALLHQGIEVVGLCQPGASTQAIEKLRLTRVVGDICDPASLSGLLRNVDWVFHVAGIADDWRHCAAEIYRTNVGGTENMLKIALQGGVKKFILTSSAAVLGLPRPWMASMDETCDFNLRPFEWVYAHSKWLAEQALQRAVKNGLDAVSLLPTAILGPADSSLITGQLIVRACKGDIFPFPHGGVNYIDVRDVAEAHIQAALKGKTGERYLLGGHNLSHLHCLGTISDVLSVPVRYIPIPQGLIPALGGAVQAASRLGINPPIDRQRVRMSRHYMYYDNAKASAELGLRPRPFEETVEDTYDWYCEHGFLQRPYKSAHLAADLAS